MPSFAENLEALPKVDGLDRLELYAADSHTPHAIIENRPGQSGSLAVYYKVSVDFGGIGPSAAHQALTLYAEHVEDARSHPGKHPNIDRLFEIIETDRYYAVRAVPKR